METISFKGNAPLISEEAFNHVVAKCYYNAENDTWTADNMKNYGGTITWIGGQLYGESTFWNLSETGELRIWGVGEMPDEYFESHQYDDAPWYDEHDSIKTLIIEEGITYISSMAFRDCTNLSSITIPSTLAELGDGAFFECSAISSIYISDINAWCSLSMRKNLGDYEEIYDEYDMCRIMESTYPHIGENIEYYVGRIFVNDTELKNVVIPDGIKEIRPYAFAHSSVTSVTIPNSVLTIRENAFGDCYQLSDVRMGNSVSELKVEAFSSCWNLRDIDLPASLRIIGSGAFESTALTNATIPDSVVSIGAYAFSCSELTEIIIGAGTQIIGDGAFSLSLIHI